MAVMDDGQNEDEAVPLPVLYPAPDAAVSRSGDAPAPRTPSSVCSRVCPPCLRGRCQGCCAGTVFVVVPWFCWYSFVWGWHPMGSAWEDYVPSQARDVVTIVLLAVGLCGPSIALCACASSTLRTRFWAQGLGMAHFLAAATILGFFIAVFAQLRAEQAKCDECRSRRYTYDCEGHDSSPCGLGLHLSTFVAAFLFAVFAVFALLVVIDICADRKHKRRMRAAAGGEAAIGGQLRGAERDIEMQAQV
eukprot:TRINITY_DN14773_c0_g1_i1.p1 TRINITY_DN14773_c0_g1~~TRINITY_DN14773_c0_g1_i1.p1  ORF type:complete len:247 (+),score=38.62 TRINITY_DN14773_c0_g1_i1:84-824(+)